MYTFTTSLGITEVEEKKSGYYIGNVKIPDNQLYKTIEEAKINLFKAEREKYISSKTKLQEKIAKLDRDYQILQEEIDVNNLKKIYPEEFICI